MDDDAKASDSDDEMEYNNGENYMYDDTSSDTDVSSDVNGNYENDVETENGNDGNGPYV